MPSKMPGGIAAMALLAAFYSGASPKLQVKVYTAAEAGFAVNSTLVYGAKDAILIDAQFVNNEARDLAELIKETRRNLTTIYITHGHPDHYFGLAVLKREFPNAKIVALPAAITGIKNGWDARRTFWLPEFGQELPPAGPVVPEELAGVDVIEGDVARKKFALTLEGEELRITGGVMGDGPNNSFVWIPSIRTVVAGDTVFNESHFTVPKDHTEWFNTLDRIAALKPSVIVPGHQRAGAKNDLTAIRFMKAYMLEWDKAVKSSHDTAELRAKITKVYPAAEPGRPGLALSRLLDASVEAAFPAGKK